MHWAAFFSVPLYLIIPAKRFGKRKGGDE